MIFQNITAGILNYIEIWENKLKNLPENLITTKKNKQNRSIKKILGHLIDSTANNHQ